MTAPRVINYFEIVLWFRHGDLWGRLRYVLDGEVFESSWEPIPILNGIITNWREDKLCGSFGIGTVLSESAIFQIVEA